MRGSTPGATDGVQATPRFPAPPVPSGLTATAGDANIALSWKDPSDTDISEYQYRVSDDGGANWSPDWTGIANSDANTTSHAVTGLTNDTTYTIEVRALRGSTPVATGVVQATPRFPAPPAPSGLTATAGDANIELIWTNPSDATISRYQVRLSTDGGTTWNPDWTRVDDILDWGNTYTYTGLTNGTVYTFELRCVSDRRNAISEVVRLTATPNPVPPLAPVGLSATAADARVRLDWTDPGDDTIDRYQYRQRAGGGSWTGWTDVADSGPTTTSHTVKDLTNGTAYSLELRAVLGRSIYGPASRVEATPSLSRPHPSA